MDLFVKCHLKLHIDITLHYIWCETKVSNHITSTSANVKQNIYVMNDVVAQSSIIIAKD